MHHNERGPTHDENKKHREYNSRCFRFTFKISQRICVVTPPLSYLLLVGTNLQKNSQIAVKHHKQRYQETREDHQQNVASAFSEGDFAHGASQRGVRVFVPTKDWEDTNDDGPGPYCGK